MSDAFEVLLADDDPVIRGGLGQTLRAAGWRITLAADGFEAMQACRHSHYDVILLDTQMPYRDGANVIRLLRAENALGNARIVMLAQPGDSDIVDQAVREGAEAVFDKSVMGPQDVVSELEVMLQMPARPQARGVSAETVPDDVQRMASRFTRAARQTNSLKTRPRAARGPVAQLSDMIPDAVTRRESVGAQVGAQEAQQPVVNFNSTVRSIDTGHGMILDRGLPSRAGQVSRAVPHLPQMEPTAAAPAQAAAAPAPAPPAQNPPSPPADPPSRQAPYPGQQGQPGPQGYGGPPQYPQHPQHPQHPQYPQHPPGRGNGDPYGAPHIDAPEAGQTMPRPSPGDGPFNTLLNKNFGEAGRLANSLGLPPDFTCPVCRGALVLRLWPDRATESGVVGHFFCPSCTRH